MVKVRTVVALVRLKMRGDRIKKVREGCDLSQRELAEISGVSEKQLGRYERGESDPTASQLDKIADALHVSVDYLMGRTDDMGDKYAEAELSPLERKLIEALRKGRLSDALNSFTALSNNSN